MRKVISTIASIMVLASAAWATEYHVAIDGNDTNAGTKKAPFRTIQHAANLAQPGDVITVHGGIYRERVSPPRGGTSDKERITYRAAPGEKVVITGSEISKNWERITNDTWKVTIPNSFFGKFNPYTNLMHGDWLVSGQWNHTGAVYLNGHWLVETPNKTNILALPGGKALWFCEVNPENTMIYAQFPDVNPNEQLVEINVRKTVFTPEKTGINFITVRGFILRQAATCWTPPTVGQIGLVTAYWCKGWIIEDNNISYSKCSGIALGKYGDEWDNKCESAEGYVGTVMRALTNGWNKVSVGGHIVRNNEISFCEQNGVVGSLGGAFSTISGNDIHDIHTQDTFWGYEIAGIKLHGAVDVLISHNHIYHSEAGIWLDWMLQGSRVTGNLLHNNGQSDLSLEVNHGPVVVDNNLFLSQDTLNNVGLSQGCAFVHNLITWRLYPTGNSDGRQTPFFKPHSTVLAGLHDNPRGDSRYINNLFVYRVDLRPYDGAKLPMTMAGNVFLKGAVPDRFELNPLLKTNFDPGIQVVQKSDGWYLEIAADKSWRGEQMRRLINTEMLGKAVVPDQTFENPDGSPLCVCTDYFGNRRNKKNPFPGPFEQIMSGPQQIKVWPMTIN